MATRTKRFFSESTNGQGIEVTASSSPGTLIHTAVSGTTSFDEIWLYVNNVADPSSGDGFLVIEWGAASPSAVDLRMPGEAGLILVIPGLVLNNSGTIRVYEALPPALRIFGYVNRITP